MSEPRDGEEQEDKSDEDKSDKVNLADLYERMSTIARDRLEKAGEVTEETIERALKEARDWGRQFKDHYADDVSRVAEFIRRDWNEGIRYARQQTRKSFDLDRLQAGILGVLYKFAHSAGNQLETLAAKLNEKMTYKTGEIAGAGTLECAQCEQQLSFDKATRIPPCPKCRSTLFRRGY